MEETWCDRCTKCWYVAMPGLATPFGTGTPVPRGAGNLKASRTLGRVDIGSGNAQIKEIKKLTQLRKLKVTGINKKNCHEFCSALEALSCLESLSMSSSGNQDDLSCLSDAVFSCPNNLRTLMLSSYLGKMPAWIMHLRNLVKVRLMCTHLTDSDGTMQLLGNLPSLAILYLGSYTFDVEGLCLDFLPEAFPCLVALDLCSAHRRAGQGEIKSVEFKQGTAPKLEMLEFRYRYDVIINDGLFSGLASLRSLKKFQLGIRSFEGNEPFVEHVRAQLALNQKRPVLI
ncbi:disease resistance protein RGA5-like [Miscanthus floridulus]|uniref:disease resistance protein RGA5-like n=1 Tax=Miscanthus floridulus TaxID=154761 RepID=UPI0034579BD6